MLGRCRREDQVELEASVACLDPRVPASWEHNSVWLDDDVDTATIVAHTKGTS